MMDNTIICVHVTELRLIGIARRKECEIIEQDFKAIALLPFLRREAVCLQSSDDTNLTPFTEIFTAEGSSFAKCSHGDEICLCLTVRVFRAIAGNRELAYINTRLSDRGFWVADKISDTIPSIDKSFLLLISRLCFRADMAAFCYTHAS